MATMCRNVGRAAVVLLVVLAMVFQGAQAQARAQCPGTASMIACQAAVTNANVQPSMSCCDKVKSVLQQFGPKCLCDAVTSPTAKAVNVILAEAVKLPMKCQKMMGLQYVKGYNCAGQTVQ